MSLILDALRKAESERERGSVPGLHAQPLPALAVEAAQPPRVRAWQWALAGIVVVGALAWYFVARDTRPTPNGSGAVPAATSAARAPLATRAQQVPSPVTSAAPTGAGGELPPAAEPAPWPTRESRGPAPAAKATPATAPDTSPVPALSPAGQSSATAPKIAPTAVAQPGVAPPALASQATPPAARSPDAPVYAVEQLPQHVRSQLPALTVTGAIYSPNPADRTLIVNGRLMRENQALTADLSLEQIGQKSAVLRFKGYRFELRF